MMYSQKWNSGWGFSVSIFNTQKVEFIVGKNARDYDKNRHKHTLMIIMFRYIHMHQRAQMVFYTGEMVALLLAIQCVADVRPLGKFMLSFSSSLTSLGNNHSDSCL